MVGGLILSMVLTDFRTWKLLGAFGERREPISVFVDFGFRAAMTGCLHEVCTLTVFQTTLLSERMQCSSVMGVTIHF